MANKQKNPAAQIEMFIGAWGVKTKTIAGVEQLRDFACRIFEVENDGPIERLASAINSLGRVRRKELARKNLLKVMGDEGQFSPDWAKRHSKRKKRTLVSDPHMLLRKVVSAVINAGHASDLYGIPEVMEVYGSQHTPESQ